MTLRFQAPFQKKRGKDHKDVQPIPMEGIFPVYKEQGITSHDVVDRIRKLTGEQRVGHAGTLDPFATGVLVVGVGREYTKKLGEILKNSEKVYRAQLRLGATSSTGDPEGKILEIQFPKSFIPPAREMIETILKGFEGHINQVPHLFSAIKIKGKRSYELARKGIEFTLEPRKVFIKEIKLLHYQWPRLDLEITCGAGVYIRSLAQDIGKKLGVGGYVERLERTRVDSFTLARCVDFLTIH